MKTKPLIITSLLAAFLVGALCFSVVDARAEMTAASFCADSNRAALCKAGANFRQVIFSSTLPQSSAIVLASLVAALALFVFYRDSCRAAWNAARRNSRHIKAKCVVPRSSLEEAFSRGILHPKLF